MNDVYYESSPTLSVITVMDDCHVLIADSPRNNSTLHWHHSIELVLVVEGCVHSVCDGFSFDTHAGECHLINSQSIHSGINRFPHQPIRALVIQISDSYLQKIFPNQPLATFALSQDTPSYSSIRAYCHDIYSLLLINDKYHCLNTISKLNAILYLLYTHCQTDVVRPTRYAKDVTDYVCSHYAEKISLDDISAHVGLQKNYFCRKFKSETGLSFNNYLNRIRLDTALNLLAVSTMSVAECAVQSGFSSEKILIDWCRKIYNTTPTKLVNRFAQTK